MPHIYLSFHFFFKLLDVFSSKTNLNLVLEFLDTDLEMIIKERSLVFLPADIKSWMAMTFRGLEFCHRNFILHRVRVVCLTSPSYFTALLNSLT
jgi:serine/threonine protein kinase